MKSVSDDFIMPMKGTERKKEVTTTSYKILRAKLKLKRNHKSCCNQCGGAASTTTDTPTDSYSTSTRSSEHARVLYFLENFGIPHCVNECNYAPLAVAESDGSILSRSMSSISDAMSRDGKTTSSTDGDFSQYSEDETEVEDDDGPSTPRGLDSTTVNSVLISQQRRQHPTTTRTSILNRSPHSSIISTEDNNSAVASSGLLCGSAKWFTKLSHNENSQRTQEHRLRSKSHARGSKFFNGLSSTKATRSAVNIGRQNEVIPDIAPKIPAPIKTAKTRSWYERLMTPSLPSKETNKLTKSTTAVPHQSLTSESRSRFWNRREVDPGSFSTSAMKGSFRRSDELKRNSTSGSKPWIAFGQKDAYQRLEMIGEGSYAKVFKGYSLLLNRIVALKEFVLDTDEGVPFTAIREASFLRGLRHANIVTLHDIVLNPKTFILVFEYLMADLHRYLQLCPKGIPPSNVRLLLFQLFRGLEFCHARKILHRDLKPQNLLISPQGELKLADWGLARARSVPLDNFSSEVITLWYRPPEVLLGQTKYGECVDQWSAGCIAIEMLIGQPLFPGRHTVTDQIDMIFRTLGTPTEEESPGVSVLPGYKKLDYAYQARSPEQAVPRLTRYPSLSRLITSLLSYNAVTRPSARTCLHHEFFGKPSALEMDFGLVDFTASLSRLKPNESVFAFPGVYVKHDFGFKHLLMNNDNGDAKKEDAD